MMIGTDCLLESGMTGHVHHVRRGDPCRYPVFQDETCAQAVGRGALADHLHSVLVVDGGRLPWAPDDVMGFNALTNDDVLDLLASRYGPEKGANAFERLYEAAISLKRNRRVGGAAEPEAPYVDPDAMPDLYSDLTPKHDWTVYAGVDLGRTPWEGSVSFVKVEMDREPPKPRFPYVDTRGTMPASFEPFQWVVSSAEEGEPHHKPFCKCIFSSPSNRVVLRDPSCPSPDPKSGVGGRGASAEHNDQCLYFNPDRTQCVLSRESTIHHAGPYSPEKGCTNGKRPCHEWIDTIALLDSIHPEFPRRDLSESTDAFSRRPVSAPGAESGVEISNRSDGWEVAGRLLTALVQGEPEDADGTLDRFADLIDEALDAVEEEYPGWPYWRMFIRDLTERMDMLGWTRPGI